MRLPAFPANSKKAERPPPADGHSTGLHQLTFLAIAAFELIQEKLQR